MYHFDSEFRQMCALDSASNERLAIRGRIAEANQNLVRSIVIDLGPRVGVHGCELEDLIGEGNIALLNAIDAFDIERGYTFANFATHRIEGAIRMYVRDKKAIIREPAWHQAERRSNGIDDAPVTTELHGLPGQRHDDAPCALDRSDDTESFVAFVEIKATLDAFLEHLENRALNARGRSREALVKQRQVLSLHFASQPAIEIARRLDISMSNVSYHIRNGIADFRRFIDEGNAVSE